MGGTMSEKKGTLIVIGGHEDKENEKIILQEVARRIGRGKLVITTVASHEPEGLFSSYERIFRSLGVEHIYKLEIEDRVEAKSEAKLRILDDATGVFFTGGDQLRITSQLGDTPIYQRIQDIYKKEGGIIIGTSAGASVVCETMLVYGDSDESHRVRSNLLMAPGFGLIKDVVIDQHFAERGRIGRLIGAIAQNPRNLGIGIDEDTAIVIEHGKSFYVLGSGAVYVVDGSEVTYSNIAEARAASVMSIYNVTLHILCQEDCFNLLTRQPDELTPEQKKRKLPAEE
jgi:cyanophycinase